MTEVLEAVPSLEVSKDGWMELGWWEVSLGWALRFQPKTLWDCVTLFVFFFSFCTVRDGKQNLPGLRDRARCLTFSCGCPALSLQGHCPLMAKVQPSPPAGALMSNP